MDKAIKIWRWLITMALIYGISTETGVFTTLGFFFIFLYTENANTVS